MNDANEVVTNTVEAVLKCLGRQELSDDMKRDLIIETITPVFDLPLMAKLALGRQHWQQLAEGERKRYTELFVEQLKDSYAGNIVLFADEEVEFGKPAQVKSKIHIDTVVISKDKRTKIVYKLYKSRDGWKVYDVEINGVSVVSSYRAQYAQVLKTGTVADLLDKMVKQIGGDGDDQR